MLRSIMSLSPQNNNVQKTLLGFIQITLFPTALKKEEETAQTIG